MLVSASPYRHAPRSGRLDQCQRGTLADGESLAAMGVEAHQRDRHIRHRHLPRADHLVARGHAAHGAVADADEEGLVRHRRQAQHALDRVAQPDHAAVERRQARRLARRIARHLRRLAEQHRQRHVHRIVVEFAVMHGEPVCIYCLADHGERAALALAQRAEFLEPLRRNRQHVTLLRLVAPDLLRRHAGLVQRNLAQLEARTLAAAVHQLRQRIRHAARTDVVDRQDRIALAHLPAAVDHFLRAALHLRVAALHRIEVEVLGVRAGVHARCRAAAQADQHAGAAEMHHQRTGRQVVLVRVDRRDVADAAGKHDRLVVAAHLAADLLLEGAEITRQVRAAEFVVERRRADRPVEHDL